jgi:hypothetical protein
MSNRILVTGDRRWSDFKVIYEALEEFRPEKICEGGADGADYLARKAAHQLGIPCRTFKAHWEQEGRAAGPIRNRRMFTLFKPHRVLAFHDDLSESKGTLNMVMLATKAGVPVLLFTHRIVTTWLMNVEAAAQYVRDIELGKA